MCDRKNINLWVTGIRGDVSLCSDNLLREISMNRKLRIGSETTGVEKRLSPEFIFLLTNDSK